MPDKKAFLSSTGRDLAEHREAAYHAIEKLDGWHCVRMEDFGARDWDADEFCRAKVTECDVLVGVVGHMHGDSPKGKQRSYTEREYDAAVEANKPRLMFVALENFPLAADLIEPDRKRKRQREFRKRVNSERVRASFRSPDDLARGIATAIHNWEQEQAAHPEASPPTAVATAPERTGGQTFALQANFTGRVRERRMLTEWLTADDHPVLSLVAIGGMGKSSVAWVWLQRDVLGLPVPGVPPDPAKVAKGCGMPGDARPVGALWWSFYEGGGTFAGFLEAAIAYCSGGEKSAADYLTVPTATGPSMDYSAMQADILRLAQQRRFLFVWDGAERLLREYGQDAAMREERDPEEMKPDARDTLEMPVSRFLEAMAGQPSSRLLVASRLYPRALERLAGSRCEELEGLAEDDAVAYLRARGIRGSRAELATAGKQYEFHPLSLSNLAADLLEDFQQEGDISGAPRYDETENLKARQHHILERAYERRAPQRRELLSRLSAMRGAIPKEVVQLLAEDIPGMEAQNLGRELNELVRHGLLRHPADDRYDFHPVVRRYCYERLEDKEKVHLRLRDYYAAVPTPDVREVQSTEELGPVIELYHHTVGAGLYDEACGLFRNQLATPLFFRFGAYQACIELLRGLFPDGEGRPPRLRKESDQGWTLNTLARSYAHSGQQRRAVRLLQRGIPIVEKLGDKKNLAIGLGNLALDQIRLGELAAAEESLRRSIALCKEIGDEPGEAVGHLELGPLAAYQGSYTESHEHLTSAQQVLDKVGTRNTNFVSVVRAYRAQRALLMGDADDGLKAGRRARGLADETARKMHPVESDFIRTEWLIGWALVEVASGEESRRAERLAEAERHLTEALRRCRRVNLVVHEPDILLAWARWHHASGNPQARADAEEALAVADRCEYRLVQADAHNLLARLALDAGDRKAAREHAEVAKERAWCDGPPHCYKPALEEAERLLAEAGSGA